VLQGALDVMLNGKWTTLKQGETVTVPKGAAHTFRNPLPSITKVYNVHSPALKFDSYFFACKHHKQTCKRRCAVEGKPECSHASFDADESASRRNAAGESTACRCFCLNRIGKWKGIKI